MTKPKMTGFGWLLLTAPVLIFACLIAFHGVTLTVAHPADANQPPADLTKSLASYVVLATVIERFWETLFNLLESLILSFGGIAGVFSVEIKNLMEAKATLINATAANPSDLATQAKLGDFNGALDAALKSPRYVANKRFITLFGSLILGLVCSISAHLGIFNQAQYAIPQPLDVILTGVLIGAGAEPVHQVITGLQSARDAVTGLAQMAKGTAIRNAVEAINQSGKQPQSDGIPISNGILSQNGKDLTDSTAVVEPIVRAQYLLHR